jgi:hypothetical protein
MLEAFLNDCLDTNGEFPREDSYEVAFSYEFLVPPPRECCMQEQQLSHMEMKIPLHTYQSSSEPAAHQKMSTATNKQRYGTSLARQPFSRLEVSSQASHFYQLLRSQVAPYSHFLLH